MVAAVVGLQLAVGQVPHLMARGLASVTQVMVGGNMASGWSVGTRSHSAIRNYLAQVVSL